MWIEPGLASSLRKLGIVHIKTRDSSTRDKNKQINKTCMSLEFSRVVSTSHSQTINNLRDELAKKKWTILMDIDVKKIQKEKVGVDLNSFDILGVCNPWLAYEAFKTSKQVGLIIPCKITVQAAEDGEGTRVTLFLPTMMIPQGIDSYDEFIKVAKKAEGELKRIIGSIPA